MSSIDTLWTEYNTPVHVTYTGDMRMPFIPKDAPQRPIPIFTPSAFKWVAQSAHERVKDQNDMNILITGSPGRGKSTLGQHIARAVNGDGFQLEDICFRGKQMMARIEQNPDGNFEQNIFPVTINDEAGVDLLKSEWWSEFQIMLIKTFFLDRIRKQTRIYILPHIADFTTRISEERINMWFYCYKKGEAEVRIAYPNQFIHEAYWKPICCVRFGEISGKFWDDYEVRKKAFLSDWYKTQIEKPDTPRKPNIRLFKWQKNFFDLVNIMHARYKATNKQISLDLGKHPNYITNAKKIYESGSEFLDPDEASGGEQDEPS